MCGLSGVVVTKPELIPVELTKAIFSLLMEENDDRGGHSWGAWGSNLKPVRGLGKYSTGPKPLHQHLKDFAYRKDDRPTFLFGHTRFGTHGEKTIDNAHPFEVGNLTLAHNGVVFVDGYTEKDHPVDSGRIAMSVYDHGWSDGLAKVEGMCALLVSVGDQPLFYRHDQVLSYAQFEWGTVVSSTLYDLELVILKKLGLEPIKVESVPEDVLCQPGFGPVRHPAPAKQRSYGGWAGHSRWYNTHEDEDPAWSDYVWDKDKKVYVSPSELPSKTTTCTGNFSGKSDLPETKKDDNVTKLMRTCAPRLVRGEDGKPEIGYEDERVDVCDYCGEDVVESDLRLCFTDWSAGELATLCMDCIMDEIATNGTIQVVGRYVQDERDDLRFGDIPDTDGVIGEDQLSPEDKADLEAYILSTYKDPHDV